MKQGTTDAKRRRIMTGETKRCLCLLFVVSVLVALFALRHLARESDRMTGKATEPARVTTMLNRAPAFRSTILRRRNDTASVRPGAGEDAPRADESPEPVCPATLASDNGRSAAPPEHGAAGSGGETGPEPFDDAAQQRALESVAPEDLPYVVRLRSRFFLPDKNAEIAFTEETKRLFLQFFDHPGDEELGELKELGVRLERYSTNHAWYATVAASTFEQVRGLDYVRGFAEIEYFDKMNERLYRQTPGAWARNDDGTAMFRVQFVEGLLFETARAILAEELAKDCDQKVVSDEYLFGCKIVACIDPANLPGVAALDRVEGVSEIEPPKKTNNVVAAQRAKVDLVRDGSAPYNLTGSGVIVGEWDGGAVGAHGDFGSRVVVKDNVSAEEHATHVAGTVIGSGKGNANARGMASKRYVSAGDENTGATLYSYDWDNALTEQTNAASSYANLRVTTHSWGYITGWYNNGWMWLDNGNSSDFGDYSADSRDWDTMARNSGLFVVNAAGNDRSDGPGTTNGYHDGRKESGWDDWYDCVGTIATAKNVLAIGATTDADGLTSFSSIGPADDGRVKPDLVMNGDGLTSTLPNNSYTSYSGTSMATPGVAGTAALLVESWRNNNGGANPSASILRAILVNTAADLGRPGPDYRFGFGLVDARKAVDLIRADSLAAAGSKFIVADSVSNGGEKSFQVSVPAGAAELRVTLAWIDPPGDPAGVNAIVNNLDVQAVEPNGTTVRYPFKLDKANPVANATCTGANSIDVLEHIVVANPTAGTWTLKVKGMSVPTGPQPFVLVSSQPQGSGGGTPTAPVIALSPTGFAFSATAGGQNPQAQALSISNSGPGTLDWTVSDNATWLSLSPASGGSTGEIDTVALSVNISSMPAGNYSAVITVSAQGAANSPQTVSVSLALGSGGGGGNSGDITLVAGYNLIALPVAPAVAYNAETLGRAINSQGGSCVEVGRYVNGVWYSHYVGSAYNNFAIARDKCYMVRCMSGSVFKVTGAPISKMSYSLVAGANPVGVPISGANYTAQGLAQAMQAKGAYCTIVYRWQNGAWDAYYVGSYMNNFAIERGRGYFVWCLNWCYITLP
ncbi:MAG: S8 family serine peptidase [Planctomycetota bacterium]|nr:S8 family serine peptidase [Planctomycetota bacterium]